MVLFSDMIVYLESVVILVIGTDTQKLNRSKCQYNEYQNQNRNFFNFSSYNFAVCETHQSYIFTNDDKKSN